MKYLIFSLLVLSMSAFAADSKSTTKNTTVPENKGVLDVTPKDKTDEIADKTPTVTGDKMAKMHVTCKMKDGHELKQGDEGYEACLKKVKAEKKNAKDPKADVDVKFEK